MRRHAAKTADTHRHERVEVRPSLAGVFLAKPRVDGALAGEGADLCTRAPQPTKPEWQVLR